MVQSATEIVEHRVLSARQAIALETAINGKPLHEIRAGLRDGTYRMFSTTINDCDSYAIISKVGDCIRIEALQGKYGLRLARALIETAKGYGLRCDAWVLSASLVRLVSRIGMKATGERHGSQLRVCA